MQAHWVAIGKQAILQMVHESPNVISGKGLSDPIKEDIGTCFVRTHGKDVDIDRSSLQVIQAG